MHREAFQQYLKASNVEGSGKASSYVRALDLLGEMIAQVPAGFVDCREVWAINSVERLEELYQFANTEKLLGRESRWYLPGIAESYLRDGYCTAAIRSYQRFLVEHGYEAKLLAEFERTDASEESLVERLQQELPQDEAVLSELYPETEGREVKREVSTRCNQRVFRKMIFSIYGNACCLTGLDVPQVNRASHIIPWAKRKSTRLDPRNGLCLSATYDAAFDRNLIGFDEDYRLLVSREIRDHYRSDIVRTYFQNQAGRRMQLPSRFLPRLEYLAEHREAGRF
ncbi:MAG: HNH endonuclease [Puniceicoccaceae bacterium]